jgi:Ca2+:H+ antiporter
VQLVLIGVASLMLWGVFVFVQTVKHRDYFLDAPSNAEAPDASHEKPTDRVALVSLVLLLVSLTAVVLLAKLLSYPLDKGVAAAGLPSAFVGVIIAAVVLLPEGLAAAKSALLNRLQNSINLSVGSAIASISLTIPTVALVSLMPDRNSCSRLAGTNDALVLTLSHADAGTGRTTVLQGAIHLIIFAGFC